MADLPSFHDRDPTGPDPNVEARFTRLENMLQELLLRTPVERPKSPVVLSWTLVLRPERI
jgi:hypothetical protein